MLATVYSMGIKTVSRAKQEYTAHPSRRDVGMEERYGLNPRARTACRRISFV